MQVESSSVSKKTPKETEKKDIDVFDETDEITSKMMKNKQSNKEKQERRKEIQKIGNKTKYIASDTIRKAFEKKALQSRFSSLVSKKKEEIEKEEMNEFDPPITNIKDVNNFFMLVEDFKDEYDELKKMKDDFNATVSWYNKETDVNIRDELRDDASDLFTELQLGFDKLRNIKDEKQDDLNDFHDQQTKFINKILKWKNRYDNNLWKDDSTKGEKIALPFKKELFEYLARVWNYNTRKSKIKKDVLKDISKTLKDLNDKYKDIKRYIETGGFIDDAQAFFSNRSNKLTKYVEKANPTPIDHDLMKKAVETEQKLTLSQMEILKKSLPKEDLIKVIMRRHPEVKKEDL